MIVSEFLEQTNWAYRANDDDAPVENVGDWAMWLGTANRKIAEYARDTKVTRQSLFEVRPVGTVSASNQSYDLDDDFLDPSDEVIVTTTDGHEVDFTIIKPQERNRFRHNNRVYVSGRDPQILTFVDTISSTSQIVGGAITMGGFYMPDPLSGPNDVIPCDDPYWLVMATAAELAGNDLTYESKAPDLVAKANNLWAQMQANNRRGTSSNPRTSPTSVTRIPGARR